LSVFVEVVEVNCGGSDIAWYDIAGDAEVMEVNYGGSGSVRNSDGGQWWWFRECGEWLQR
jgi:hypothetical protein